MGQHDKPKPQNPPPPNPPSPDTGPSTGGGRHEKK